MCSCTVIMHAFCHSSWPMASSTCILCIPLLPAFSEYFRVQPLKIDTRWHISSLFASPDHGHRPAHGLAALGSSLFQSTKDWSVSLGIKGGSLGLLHQQGSGKNGHPVWHGLCRLYFKDEKVIQTGEAIGERSSLTHKPGFSILKTIKSLSELDV